MLIPLWLAITLSVILALALAAGAGIIFLLWLFRVFCRLLQSL